MTIGERIRKLRRSLDLTQKEFAERLGVKANTIGTYEIGRNAPIDAVINLICREFGVSETWLRTGKGEMFSPKEDVDLSEYAKENGITPAEESIIRAWLAFPADKRREVVEHMRRYLSANGDKLLSENPAALFEEEDREETPEERHERHKREARAEADELYEVILKEKAEQDNPDATFGSNSFGGGVA